MRSTLAAFRLLVMLLWSALLIPVQILWLALDKGASSQTLPHLWHVFICRLFGIKTEIEGTPVTGVQTLFVSNHVSYLDIPLIGNTLPCSFVAKGDVASWPFFGLLAKLQQTVFVSRNRHTVKDEHNDMIAALASGRNLVIFPEGTSSDGSKILPFKSALFNMALNDSHNDRLMIQPVTIALLETGGRPADTPAARDLYAWHGDMILMPHLWNFAKTKGVRVRLVFHPAHRASAFSDRKELARICYEQVQKGLDTSLLAKAA